MKIIFVVPKFEMVLVGIGYILALIKKVVYNVNCLYKKDINDIDRALKNTKFKAYVINSNKFKIYF